jgi:hypothetical protein
MEQEEEAARAAGRKMSVASFGSVKSDNSDADEGARAREEEDRRRREEREEERRKREERGRQMREEETRKKEERRREEEERRRKEEKMREERERKRRDEEERKRAEREARRRAEEAARASEEEEARRKAEEEEERRRAEEEEHERVTEELARKLMEQLELEEAERLRLAEEEQRIREAEEAAKAGKKRKVTGERSKKPTMAREWRKLKQREKAEAVAPPPAPPRPDPEPVEELPARVKYVKPVFQENEQYDSRHGTFLRGDWPHNNKKGIPTPAELAEAGFFFIGPGDYCRCYQCGLEQMCWDPFEDPWIRHAFLAPDCCYVERIKGRVWVEAVGRGDF